MRAFKITHRAFVCLHRGGRFHSFRITPNGASYISPYYTEWGVLYIALLHRMGRHIYHLITQNGASYISPYYTEWGVIYIALLHRMGRHIYHLITQNGASYIAPYYTECIYRLITQNGASYISPYYTEWGVIYIALLHRMGRHIYRLITQWNHISSAGYLINVFVYGLGVGSLLCWQIGAGRCSVMASWCRPVHSIGYLVQAGVVYWLFGAGRCSVLAIWCGPV